jgi:outer membrane immunogenic protein
MGWVLICPAIMESAPGPISRGLRMKRLFLAGIGACTLAALTLPAVAADIPVKAPVAKAPVTAPLFNWSGFYVGASVGYNGHQTEWNDLDNWYIQGIFDIKSSGAIVGADAGYNWQTGNLVYGIETDLSYSWAKKRFRVPVAELVFIDTKARLIGTTRVRLGYAVDKTLFYLTGGLAYSNSKAHWIEASGAQWEWADWNIGYALGGGIEYAFSNPHWTVRLEALLLQFKDYAAKIVADDPGSPEDYRMRVRNRDVIVRVAVNRKY